MNFRHAISVLIVTTALAGCNRSINSIVPRSGDPQTLPSAPVDSVFSGGELPSANGQPISNEPTIVEAPTAPMTPQVQEGAQIASVAPNPSSEPVTREGVSGTWEVKSDNPQCRIILAFSKWSGGYRATSLRCQSTELSSIEAWDVKGVQIVLFDGGGNILARLYNSGDARYDGTTNSGNAISFTRS